MELSISLPAEDILAHLPCGIVVLGEHREILWLNNTAESLLGLNWQGKAWRALIQTVFIPREDDGHEISLADGRRLRVDFSTLMPSSKQIVTLTDLTVTRDYEEAKANQNQLLAIGQMMAQLAHQLRTPLAAAMLYTDHLKTQVFNSARCLQWLQRLQSSHASIEQQIQDLLLFARGENIQPAATNIEEWCAELSEKAYALIKKETVTLIINSQVQKTNLSLHGESLTGAILNLILNAMQAQASCIILTIQQQGERLLLKIADNGQGMAEEIKAQAFSPFFTTKAQGTGLGLAVVQGVIKAHGGGIEIDSLPGQGCCVTINLPG